MTNATKTAIRNTVSALFYADRIHDVCIDGDMHDCMGALLGHITLTILPMMNLRFFSIRVFVRLNPFGEDVLNGRVTWATTCKRPVRFSSPTTWGCLHD